MRIPSAPEGALREGRVPLGFGPPRLYPSSPEGHLPPCLYLPQSLLSGFLQPLLICQDAQNPGGEPRSKPIIYQSSDHRQWGGTPWWKNTEMPIITPVNSQMD